MAIQILAPEKQRILEITAQLDDLRYDYGNVLPLFEALKRKKLSLENQINTLEQERQDLMQGQLLIKV